MRKAALMLAVIAFAAALWAAAVATRLVDTRSGAMAMEDGYYAIAGARYRLPLLLLAAVNALAVFGLAGRARRAALWLVLAGAGFVLAHLAAQYWLLERTAFMRRVPEYGDAFLWSLRTVTACYWLAAFCLVGGWLAWLVSVLGQPRPEG